MKYAELKMNTLSWQRALKFAGFYRGKLDGLTGPLTREAATQWEISHGQLQAKYGQVDSRSESYLWTLQPLAAMRVRQVIVALRGQADWKIICGVRTYDEQDALYNKRPRVTRARGGQSMHNFGLAADFCLFENGRDIWTPSDGPKSIYAPLAEATRQAGLVWGGDFRTIYDPGHIQLGEISTAALHRAYTQGTSTLAALLK